jgi:hypothetical protein
VLAQRPSARAVSVSLHTVLLDFKLRDPVKKPVNLLLEERPNLSKDWLESCLVLDLKLLDEGGHVVAQRLNNFFGLLQTHFLLTALLQKELLGFADLLVGSNQLLVRDGERNERLPLSWRDLLTKVLHHVRCVLLRVPVEVRPYFVAVLNRFHASA